MKNAIILFFLSIILSSFYVTQIIEGKIIGIKDGDTYELLTADKKVVVLRLAHIDCPEKAQPYGKVAKQYASNLCFGKMAKATITSYDRNKRAIVEINCEGKNVNLEMIRGGMAWHFKKYSKDIYCANAELEARKYKRGLWQDANPIAPWDWRKVKHAK
jgi:endonuclease YncB( thermonuclease family)